MYSLRERLDVLLHPSCFLQLYPFCREWENELTYLLDHGHRFHRIGPYEANIGQHRVWIENHPYASFRLGGIRPRRATILRAWRMLNEDRARNWLAARLGMPEQQETE